MYCIYIMMLIYDEEKSIYQYTFGVTFLYIGGCRGLDHLVVGFTTTCAISAYQH
jgi:hypothetical protein